MAIEYIDDPQTDESNPVSRALRGAETIEAQEPAGMRMLPGFGQFVGGLGGFAAGGMVGHPNVGAAAGGTVGRGAGILLKESLENMDFKNHPVYTALKVGLPLFGMADALVRMPEKEKKLFADNMLSTLGMEAAGGALGFGVSKMFNMAARNAGVSILGRGAVERGREGVGGNFKNIMNPIYWSRRAPAVVNENADTFFKNAGNNVGEELSDLFSTKYKNVNIDITPLKEQVKAILPKSGNVLDILDTTVSTKKKQIISDITDSVLKMKGDFRRAKSVWNLRKELDKNIRGLSWDTDSLSYLNKVRNVLNAPLKQLGKDVEDGFAKYSLVKNAEEELGKFLEGIPDLAGQDIYSLKLGNFAKGLIKNRKNDAIDMLKRIDSFNKPEQRIINKVLDYGAAQAIDEHPANFLWTLVGGKKMAGTAGALAQEPIMQNAKKGIGRLAVTGVSESLQKQGIDAKTQSVIDQIGGQADIDELMQREDEAVDKGIDVDAILDHFGVTRPDGY